MKQSGRIIDAAQIDAWLAAGPDATRDILGQSASTERIAAGLAALANSRGGVLLLTGAPTPAETQVLYDRALAAALLPEPRLAIPLPCLARDGRGQPVVALTVPGGLPQAYALRGRYLSRSGQDIMVLATRALQRLLLERGQVSHESQLVEGAMRRDLDGAAVAHYRRRLQMGQDSDDDALLQRCGAMNAMGQPTVAGILLFAREPERFLRSSEIVAVRYPGTIMSDRFVREDIRGRLMDQIQRAEAFVLANMRRGVGLVGLERVEEPEYPLEVVREAIVNAVAHRDYGVQGEGIRLLMFSDRLEVYSPGRLAGQVTVENILDERYSRNPVIVQVLADLGYIERLGYGIDRMVQLLALAGLPPPEFAETANGFRVTVRAAQSVAQPQPLNLRNWHEAGLNPRQMQLLVYLDEQPHISQREYQDLCPEVSAETRRRDLAELVQRGILLKIGEKRGTYYVLK